MARFFMSSGQTFWFERIQHVIYSDSDFFLLTRSLSLPHPVLPVVGHEIAGVPRVKQGLQEVLKFPIEIFW